MAHKKDNEALRTTHQLDRLQWETQKKLGLQGNEFGKEITPEDIGVAQMRQLVKNAENDLQREGSRKFDSKL